MVCRRQLEQVLCFTISTCTSSIHLLYFYSIILVVPIHCYLPLLFVWLEILAPNLIYGLKNLLHVELNYPRVYFLFYITPSGCL